MTDSIGNGHEASHIPDGIPIVSPEIITAFRAEPHKFDELFNQIKEEHPELARFILTRAAELTPGNLQDRERMARLVLETLGIIASQAEAAQVREWFDAGTADEPDPPTAAA